MDTDRDGQDRWKVLFEEIERAFDGVERGAGITLHQANVIDAYGSKAEEADARKKDTDTRWQDIPDEWIEHLGDAFTFLYDAESFRYYVPAFMIWTLRHYSTCDKMVADAVAFTLGNGPTTPQTLNRCQLLNDPQKRAVAHFLQAYAQIADEYNARDAHKALDEHWGQFL